jgi:predicted tellurium resistance membrane protein TerC
MQLAIVYVGGILGIVAMRFVAGYFIKLLDRFAGLASGAYYLVAWIGLKLVGSGFHDALYPPPDAPKPAWHSRMPDWVFRVTLEMPWWLFWAGMGIIIVLSLLASPRQPPTVQPPLTEEEILA